MLFVLYEKLLSPFKIQLMDRRVGELGRTVLPLVEAKQQWELWHSQTRSLATDVELTARPASAGGGGAADAGRAGGDDGNDDGGTDGTGAANAGDGGAAETGARSENQ